MKACHNFVKHYATFCSFAFDLASVVLERKYNKIQKKSSSGTSPESHAYDSALPPVDKKAVVVDHRSRTARSLCWFGVVICAAQIVYLQLYNEDFIPVSVCGTCFDK